MQKKNVKRQCYKNMVISENEKTCAERDGVVDMVVRGHLVRKGEKTGQEQPHNLQELPETTDSGKCKMKWLCGKPELGTCEKR